MLIVSDYWLQPSPLIALPRDYSGYFWYYVSVLCFPTLFDILAQRELIILCLPCLNIQYKLVWNLCSDAEHIKILTVLHFNLVEMVKLPHCRNVETIVLHKHKSLRKDKL